MNLKRIFKKREKINKFIGIQIFITDYCNQNCSKCAAYSPLGNKALWENLNRYNIMLCPTKYDNGVPWDTIKQKAAEYGIGYEFYCSGVTENGIEIPVRSFMKWELDIEGKQKPLCNFQECERSRIGKIGTYSLRDGKLYICCVMACIHLFNKYFERSLLPIETDYLDIYKTKKYSQILSYLNVSRPIEFCGFCKTRKYSSGSPLERSKREISEWT